MELNEYKSAFRYMEKYFKHYKKDLKRSSLRLKDFKREHDEDEMQLLHDIISSELESHKIMGNFIQVISTFWGIIFTVGITVLMYFSADINGILTNFHNGLLNISINNAISDDGISIRDVKEELEFSTLEHINFINNIIPKYFNHIRVVGSIILMGIITMFYIFKRRFKKLILYKEMLQNSLATVNYKNNIN